MKNLKEYNGIKDCLNELQLQRLELITDFLIHQYKITRADLFSKSRKRVVAEARRKIAFLGRFHFNIEGKIISKYLQLNEERVSQMIHSGWDYCTVDGKYYNEIQDLMVKLQMYHNVSLSPLI